MTVRILVAPLEFKGSLTAGQAARAIEAGVRAGWPEAEVAVLPLADGGPGTADALVDALGGEWHTAWAHDALGRPLQAQWASRPGGGVVEMARASGLSLLAPAERNALVATTIGTGELIADAIESGIRSLLIGVGGSATNDGGTGALQALGYRFLDASGRALPPGGAALRSLARIVPDGMLPGVRSTEITVMTDVLNPLCGPTGASHVYGPQKGASAQDVEVLDAALAHLAEIVRRDLGDTRQAFIAVGRLVDGIAFQFERAANLESDQLFVIDDENVLMVLIRHVAPPTGRRCSLVSLNKLLTVFR